MAMLECPGVFTLVLEGEWTVTGTPGRFYELTRAGSDAGSGFERWHAAVQSTPKPGSRTSTSSS
ncbi:MAG: hypothetical protein ACRDYC_12505 [Acidimicrobiales bacterium]